MVVALLPLSLPLWAQHHATEAFDPAVIQKQIAYLASDELKGRDSGEPGNEKAAQFIAQEFAHAGLKPLGTSHQRDAKASMDGSGYYQPFAFMAGHEVGKGCVLEADYRGDSETHHYQMGKDFQPVGVSGGGKAQGQVLYIGYGIHAPQAGHDDYANTEVKGRIVMLLAGSPDQNPHGPLAEYGDIRRKAADARDRGAAAVLVILPKETATVAPRRFEYFGDSDAGIPAFRITRDLAGSILRPVDRQEALERWEGAAGMPGFKPMETSTKVRLVADVKKVEKVTANVVGLIEGSNPTLKSEVVVIGGHLDHLGMGSPYSLARSDAPAVHHGADDNASGAEGVMALARYFGHGAVRPKRSLVLMCFSGEELGLYGSSYYVKHPIVPLEQTVAMLNMDMIGRLRDDKLIVIGGSSAKEWPDLLESVNKTAGFKLADKEDGPSFGGSDHESFENKGIPVLFFFTGGHPDYHTPTDTADKINAPGEAKVLRMVAECAQRIADNPARPTYQKPAVTTPSASIGFRVYFGSIPDYAAMVEGVQLTGVREGSPADKAGLKAGDIIVKFGDRVVKNVQDYTFALQDHKPGDKVEIVIKRGDQTLTLTATLAARRE